jgi:hypothetical protein
MSAEPPAGGPPGPRRGSKLRARLLLIGLGLLALAYAAALLFALQSPAPHADRGAPEQAASPAR